MIYLPGADWSTINILLLARTAIKPSCTYPGWNVSSGPLVRRMAELHQSLTFAAIFRSLHRVHLPADQSVLRGWT
jgi:hypothetical protein